MLRRALACFAVLLATACSSMPPGPVADPAAALEVRDGAVVWKLEPGSPAHRELTAWLASHRGQWRQLFYTPPPVGGLGVTGPGLSLRIWQKSAIATMPDGLPGVQPIAPGELTAFFAAAPAGR